MILVRCQCLIRVKVHLEYGGIYLNNKIRVSDIVTHDEIKLWKNGEVVIINAKMGYGKSHFVKNTLYDYAKKNNKKILMLLHRTNCVQQFQWEIESDNKTSIIDIRTYQSLESKYKSGVISDNDLEKYDYIVCDEYHYFLGDAAFNVLTDISFNLIMEQQKSVRLLMSATDDDMVSFLNHNHKNIKPLKYTIPSNNDYLESLTFFNNYEMLIKYANKIIENESKGIFFIKSAERAYALYSQFKDVSIFNCSKSNSNYKYVDQSKIDNLLKNEKFEDKILITTTCMDAGINIIDEEVKYIILDVDDLGSMIQCLGRRRIMHDDDKILVFIKNISNKSLGGKKSNLMKKLDMASYLKNHTVKEYLLAFPRQSDLNQIVYDAATGDDDKGTKKINSLMLYKCGIDVAKIAQMLEYDSKYGYCKYVSDLFGFDKDGAILVEEEKEGTSKLLQFLESIAHGEAINKEEKEELICKVDARKDGKRLKSLESLNKKLCDMRIPYQIKRVTSKKRIVQWCIETIKL